MIQFHLTRGHAYTLAEARRSPLAPALRLGNYDQLLRARTAARATHIFADLERLGHWDLELAADLWLQMRAAGLRVLNNPAHFKNRHTLLRTLFTAGLNDFNAWRPHELEAVDRFPVFLRKIQEHRAPLGGLLENRDAARRAIADAIAGGIPEESLVLIQFAGEPVRPGVWRKFAAFRIGPAIVPHFSVHDTQWLVKYGFAVPDIEDLYREEREQLDTNPFAAHLWKVFEAAGVEYGRADFAFWRGKIQVFEINTNPTIPAPGPHPSAIRTETMKLAWQKYLTALHTVDSSGGASVPLADGRKRHRVWKYIFTRSRKVP